MRESVRAELRALGGRMRGCLLRRSGTFFHPAPLPCHREPPVTGPLRGLQELLVRIGPGRGPARLVDTPDRLAPLRPLVGDAASAILCPVPPPSPSGVHQLHLLLWSDTRLDGEELDEALRSAARIAAGLLDVLRQPRDIESGGNLEEALSGSSQGVLICRADSTVVWSNRAGERAVGPDVRLKPGDALFDRIDEGARVRIRSLMEVASSGAWASEELDLGEGSGQPRPHHLMVDAAAWEGQPAYVLSLRGLTERDRLVELLRREKDFTRSLLEAANACVLGLDLQGRAILFNKVFQEVVNYRLADVLGRDAVQVMVPESARSGWREAHLVALSGAAVTDRDFTVRTRSGEIRILCLSAGRINDAQGAARGVLWTGRDVTEERARESSLRGREESTSRSLSQLKEFSRISSIILQEKSLDNVCKMFVDALSKVSTFRRAILTLCDADFRGYKWYFAGLSEKEQETFHGNKMTRREQVTIFQERFRLGNSYYIPHSEGWDYTGVRSKAVHEAMHDWHPDDFLFIPLYGTNRKLVGVVSVDDPEDGRRPTAESISPLELFANQVAHSIEERKLDQEVRQSTERYRMLVETMHEGVFSVDLRERILMANATLSQLLGVPELLLNGRPLGSIMDPESLERFRTRVALHEGGRVARFEVNLRSEKGEAIPVQVSASPYMEDEEHRGCFAVVRDLRGEKKAEEERRAMQKQLAQAEKLSALGEMISGIAHELNNPLTGVMGFSELLLSSDAPEAITRSVEKIHRDATRCKKIVQNLLDFGRSRDSVHEPVDLNELVEATLEIRTNQLKVDGIEVVMDLDPDLPKIVGDFHKLQQVILNLVNNAHQAMVDDGPGGRLVLRTRASTGHVTVSCADSGPGIPQDSLQKIFDPFFTTKEIGKGTGLGLSLSYGIVQKHRGDIKVTSTVGQGTTFTVRLPIPEELPVKRYEEAKVAGKLAPVEGKEILVVDDEESIVDLLESVLLQAGHRVTTASNGRQALERIKEFDYDVIISDLKMPDMGGQKLYDRVSEIKPHLKERMIFSTGDTVNPTTQDLFQKTGNLHIAKPFRLEEVDQVIRRVLERQRGNGAMEEGRRPSG